MPAFFQALDTKTTQLNQKQTRGLALHLIFHRFSTFNCCLSVVLQLDKGDYPEHSHVVFCPDKQRSLEPCMCLDLGKRTQLLGTSTSCLFSSVFWGGNISKFDRKNFEKIVKKQVMLWESHWTVLRLYMRRDCKKTIANIK